MTNEEAKSSASNKVKAIESLCRQLQVTPVAKQILTKEGMIELVVLYSDTEKYNIDDNKKNEKQNKFMDEVDKMADDVFGKKPGNKFRIRPSVIAGSESEKGGDDQRNIGESGEDTDSGNTN